MASLLGGSKFNGVFTLAVQGISKAVGFLTKAVITLVDEVVETVSTLTAPLTDALTQLPVVGDTLKNCTRYQYRAFSRCESRRACGIRPAITGRFT